MSPLVIFGVLAALLFGGVYLTKRRFGILGLALAGGSVMAGYWGEVGGLFFAAMDIYIGVLSPENLALIVITLLPALMLLLRGPSYHSSFQRLGASVLFTLLALALVLDPLQSLLVANPTGAVIFSNLMRYRELIIAGGLALAFIDILFIKGSAHPKPSAKH